MKHLKAAIHLLAQFVFDKPDIDYYGREWLDKDKMLPWYTGKGPPTPEQLRAGKVIGIDPVNGAKFVQVGTFVFSYGVSGNMRSAVNEGLLIAFQNKVRDGEYHSRIEFYTD